MADLMKNSRTFYQEETKVNKIGNILKASLLVASLALALGLGIPERLRAVESAGGTCVEPYTSLCGIFYSPWGPIPLYGDYTPQAE